ncbi:tetratricopeptide repeat protein, partial [Myxococcota bacterium]|nr:tetratricopeptide repeat protein [Myxococcota bacterium]
LLRLGRAAEAEALFDKVTAIDPRDVVALNSKASLLLRLGRAAEAEALFDKVFTIDPRDVVALNSKASLLLRLGRVEEAEQLFDKVFAIDPCNAVALNVKANLLAKMGRIDEAMELYRGIPGGAANQNTHCGLAFLLLKRNSDEKDILEASHLFEEAQRIEPQDTVVQLGFWTAYARLGDAKQAEYYRGRFEQCREMESRTFSLALCAIQGHHAVNSFEDVKQFITVSDLTVPAEYRRIIGIVFAYAMLLMNTRQQMSMRQIW